MFCVPRSVTCRSVGPQRPVERLLEALLRQCSRVVSKDKAEGLLESRRRTLLGAGILCRAWHLPAFEGAPGSVELLCACQRGTATPQAQLPGELRAFVVHLQQSDYFSSRHFCESFCSRRLRLHTKRLSEAAGSKARLKHLILTLTGRAIICWHDILRRSAESAVNTESCCWKSPENAVNTEDSEAARCALQRKK